jgi:hypothetical protein
MRGCEELKTGADVKIPSPRGWKCLRGLLKIKDLRVLAQELSL